MKFTVIARDKITGRQVMICIFSTYMSGLLHTERNRITETIHQDTNFITHSVWHNILYNSYFSEYWYKTETLVRSQWFSTGLYGDKWMSFDWIIESLNRIDSFKNRLTQELNTSVCCSDDLTLIQLHLELYDDEKIVQNRQMKCYSGIFFVYLTIVSTLLLKSGCDHL